MTTWISATGQSWKLRVFWGLFVVTALCAGVAILALNNTVFADGAIMLALLWVVSGLVMFCWLAFAFRCDLCDARPVWLLINRADAGNWFVQLLQAERCPVCSGLRERPDARQ